jgi:hypothetical protein
MMVTFNFVCYILHMTNPKGIQRPFVMLQLLEIENIRVK